MATGGRPAAAEEVTAGERFAFGRNWQHFLTHLDEERIQEAVTSLAAFLGDTLLSGAGFLDAGSGSGLMSLAAQRLGARPISSFDYDLDSVACTRRVRDDSQTDAKEWSVMQGSLLDADFLSTLGQFDVVYCWGVAHHTGAMWQAMANLMEAVRPGGRMIVAVYNDQGWRSAAWRRVKRAYVRGGVFTRVVLVTASAPLIYVPAMARALARAISRVTPARRESRVVQPTGTRGMSRWNDLIDWVGGYPFEYASPDDVVDFFAARDFVLEKMETCGKSLGCNQFLMRRQSRVER